MFYGMTYRQFSFLHSFLARIVDTAFASGFFLAVVVAAQAPSSVPAPASGLAPRAEPPVIPLWDGPAPGARGNEPRDVPTVTMYLPHPMPKQMTAVVVFPGGGYQGLATKSEGKPAQEFLNSLGVAVFMLKYRLGPRYHHPVELGDAQRAIRLVRARAAEWGIIPTRIGIMGFSAGGHLASTASTHFDAGNPNAADVIDRMSSRPDFSILVYPVISLTQPWTHQGSKINLLGEPPDSVTALQLSSERMVTSHTPPTFLVHTNADKLVPPENSVYYYLALRNAGVNAELHILQNGAHGISLGNGDPALSVWPTLLGNWMRVNGWVQ
jgi:acetyl esterase/lipase